MAKSRSIKGRIPELELLGRVLPSSVNEEERSFEMVFTTDSPVTVHRFKGFSIEVFREILDMKEGSVVLKRLLSGAPLLNSHRSWGLSDQVGVVETAFISGGDLVGRVRLSKRKDVDWIWTDVRDGILRNASIGYRVYKYKDETPKGAKMKTLRATLWEPLEVSLVTIPADADAGLKSKGSKYNEVEIFLKNETEESMPEIVEKEKVDSIRTEGEIRESENTRVGKILRAVRLAGLPVEFAETLIEKKLSVEDAQEEIMKKWSSRENKESIDGPAPRAETTREESDTRREGMSEALLHRYDNNGHKLTEKGKPYMRLSLRQMAEEYLKRSGETLDAQSIDRLFEQRGSHSTSDFPYLLENVAKKRIRKKYEEARQTFRPLVTEVTATDFKEIQYVQLGAAPTLEEVQEESEVRYVTVDDSGDKYKLSTYQNGVKVTRRVILNDEFNLVLKMIDRFADSAAARESESVWGEVINNRQVSDGKPLFHADHKNLQRGAALSEDSISIMRAAMRDQVNDQGREINLSPKYLVVGSALETEASKLLAPMTGAGGFNVFGGKFELIIEPSVGRGRKSKNYYLFAAIPQIEIAYLQDEKGVQTRIQTDFETRSLKIVASLDFGSKVIGWQGIQYNPGS